MLYSSVLNCSRISPREVVFPRRILTSLEVHLLEIRMQDLDDAGSHGQGEDEKMTLFVRGRLACSLEICSRDNDPDPGQGRSLGKQDGAVQISRDLLRPNGDG